MGRLQRSGESGRTTPYPRRRIALQICGKDSAFLKDRKNSFRGFRSSAAEKKETIESKPEFRLPAGGRNPASGAAERWDAVCGDGEQAEDFCDHGAGILAGLVGQRRGEQFF
jgi:hypothetical protein